MNKKKALALLCALTLCAGALALSGDLPTRGQTPAGGPPPPAPALGTKESPSPSRAPEHVVYAQFFRHAKALREKAGDEERRGRNGRALRSHYKDKMGLKDEHARALDRIADDFEAEAGRLDARAKRLIDDARARFPGGVVPPGASLPPPPPELKQLQRRRDMAVMRARHQLRAALGEHGFKQVDDYLKLNFAPNVRPAQPAPREAFQPQQHGPANTGGGR
jgi:hypothetical protein